MANMIDCMVRNLQRFVEYDLGPIVPWDQVSITIPADGENNAVELEFALEGKKFYIRIDSPELQPPLGRITMDEIIRGSIDEVTWNDMALEIKTWHAARITDRSHRKRAYG